MTVTSLSITRWIIQTTELKTLLSKYAVEKSFFTITMANKQTLEAQIIKYHFQRAKD